MTNNFIEQLGFKLRRDEEEGEVGSVFMTHIPDYHKSAKILHQIATDPNLKVVSLRDENSFRYADIDKAPCALEALMEE